MPKLRTFLSLFIGAAATVCFAQPNRILSKIDNSRSIVMSGRVHPFATASNDVGPVENSFPLSLTLLLKPTDDQQSNLDQLLQDQQNPASSGFHRWLSPEQYADRFGASSSDTQQIVAWLQAQGFVVDPVSRSRTFLTFGGTAAQVQATFGTAIHRYKVNGESHFANASNPKLPAAISSMVAGIRGMNDFHPKPRVARAKPDYTIGPGNHVMAPDDFATIYDVTPLYTAGTNGTGQSIAIVGQSALSANGVDTTNFWTKFGISAKLSQKLVNSRLNPGIVQGDVDEAALDTEWAGAVARSATIVFVYSNDVWTSAMYAVDQNLAPVLSMSYGICEMYDLADIPSNRQVVLQANVQGITWLAPAGDQGATDCDAGVTVAEGGLAVDEPGSIPEVTSMGGTAVSNSSAYWNNGNTSTTLASAKGYVPESVWNDSAADGTILAAGGGISTYFPQPSWQTTGGVPNDGWRHVPDLAFNASVYSVPFYVSCTACQGGQGGVEYEGGTSAAVPTMAGVVALLNQTLGSKGLGNINPMIYRLAQKAPNAFHDVTAGNNISACASGSGIYNSPGCVNGQEGYSAGTGYDSASGLGSLDVAKFVGQWSSQAITGSVVAPSTDQTPVYQGNAEICGNSSQWNFQLTLTEEAGVATTLTGFSINGADHSQQISAVFGSPAIPARGSISGCYSLSLSSVPANETFAFSGMDANGAAWSTAITVPFQGPLAPASVTSATNAASYQQAFAPGMIMALFGTGLGPSAQAASTIPLPEFMQGFQAYINGYPAPLYYVGPNQVNLQIPYEVTGRADLTLYTPYQPNGIDYFFTVGNAAPGIFTFQDGYVNPSRTAKVGQTIPIFVTGEGKVTPALADGATPSSGTPVSQLPKPRQTVSVTVGGIAANSSDPNWFVGIPSGLVGVTQINFTIPPGVPSGQQPVVVTIGSAQAQTAYITIQ